MTQWEQLKNEYRDMTVPANGQAQMLAAMEKARQKRSSQRKYVKYGSLVAAAMLLLLLVPDNLFRMGSKSAAPETVTQDNGGMMFDAVVEESAVEEGWFADMNMATGSAEAPDCNVSVDAPTAEDTVSSAVTEASPMERIIFSDEELEAIALEIEKQSGEKVVIDNSIEYYINEQGLLVILFEAGESAQEEQGAMEFVIPNEVVSP